MPLWIRALWTNTVSRTQLLILTLIIVGIFLVVNWLPLLTINFRWPAVMVLAIWNIVLSVMLAYWTCGFYRNAKRHIEKHGFIDKRMSQMMSGTPCERAGLKLATRDMNRGKIIKVISA